MNNRIISCWLSFAVVMLIAFNAAAMESSSAQSGYRIGPNDVIRIQVFGDEDLTVESRVGGDGKLNYPLLRVMQVEGHTTEDPAARYHEASGCGLRSAFQGECVHCPSPKFLCHR